MVNFGIFTRVGVCVMLGLTQSRSGNFIVRTMIDKTGPVECCKKVNNLFSIRTRHKVDNYYINQSESRTESKLRKLIIVKYVKLCFLSLLPVLDSDWLIY